jgi:hypothetical protein
MFMHMKSNLTALILSLFSVAALGQTPSRELGSDATAPKFRDALVSTSLIQDQAFAWSEVPRESIGALYDLDRLKQRRWSIQSALSAGYSYEDNVNLRPGGKGGIGSGVYTVAPSVAARYQGSHGFSFGARYGVSYQNFDNSALKSAFNQNAGANFNWGEGALRVYGTLGFIKQASANVDAGDRIKSHSILASLGMTYNYSPKTTVGLTYTFSQFTPENKDVFTQNNVTFNQSLITTTMQQVGTFVNYQYSPKTTLGLGADAGISEVSRGSGYSFYRLLVRSSWAFTPKLTLNGSVGPQFNKPEGDSGRMSAYWNMGINYRMVDTGKTTFGLNVYRNQFSSIALVSQSYNATGISGSVTYVPVSRLRLSTALGYEHAQYVSNSRSVTASRIDDFYFVRPAVVYAFTHYASLSLYYQYSQNFSTGFGSVPFTRNTFGAMVNITY